MFFTWFLFSVLKEEATKLKKQEQKPYSERNYASPVFRPGVILKYFGIMSSKRFCVTKIFFALKLFKRNLPNWHVLYLFYSCL